MSGLLSRHPSPAAVRLVLAGEGLLLVALTLVLGSARTLDQTLAALAGVIIVFALVALVAAIGGCRLSSGSHRDR